MEERELFRFSSNEVMPPGKKNPGITVCLLGSRRYSNVMEEVGRQYEREGYTVHGLYHFLESASYKEVEAKKRDIEEADFCCVVNAGGYVDEALLAEVDYATEQGIPVLYKWPAFLRAS